MKPIQKEGLEILKFFKRFAEENNIEYFLIDGTLLGAIRHRGFIPWDDDIDVGLLRPEYDKFESLFIKSNYKEKNLIYQSRRIFPYQAYSFSKIRSKTLNVRERMPTTQQGNVGAWLDIFPLDKVPVEEEKQYKLYKKLMFYNNIIKKFLLVQVEPQDRGIKKVLKYFVQKCNEKFHQLYFFLPPLFKKRDYYINLYNDTESPLYANLTYMHYKSFEEFKENITSHSIIGELDTAVFEDEEYKVPEDYHAFLTTTYGDYMIIPEEKDRKEHKLEWLEE